MVFENTQQAPMFGNPNMGTPQGYYNYSQRPNVPIRMENYLTNEEITRLMKKGEAFTLSLTETEQLKAMCNHMLPGGTQDAIVEDRDTGVCKCEICQYEFIPLDPTTSKEDIAGYINNTIDVIQTIKMLYPELPKDVATQYYMIIPLLMKTIDLFDIACKNYIRREPQSLQYNNGQPNIGQIFSMLSGAPNTFGAYNAPNPMMYGQQPQQAAPTGNPFFDGMAYGNPTATNGFVMNGQPGYQYGAMAQQSAVNPTLDPELLNYYRERENAKEKGTAFTADPVKDQKLEQLFGGAPAQAGVPAPFKA